MLSLDIKNIKNVYEDKKEFQNIAKAIRKSKKCIVVTGAGISVSGGIPDFRSSDGLYNLVKNKFPQAVVKGKDLFDATLFRDPVTTKVFYTFMGELKEILNKAKITPTHRFVKDLDNQGKLLRCYTQNIDSLERKLELSTDITDKKNAKIVQLHGDMDRVVCTLCQETFEFTNDHKAKFKEGNSVPCPSCQSKSNIRELTGKRAISVGSLRPNIVLYNEHHINGDLINDFANYDMSRKPDLLIVIGTSLKVYGIKNLVKRLAQVVHSRKTGKVIFINKTELGCKSWEEIFDYEIISTSDEAVTLIKKEIDYLNVQEAIKKEMIIRKEELKEELKAKGIKYNPRIHKFNEITPDQTILKIEDKTGNLVVHIPHKSIKIESEDESNSSSSEDKMIIASSPTLSVASVFSSSSSLSSVTDMTEFEDNGEEQIILDNIDNSHNLQEILAKGEEEIKKNEIEYKKEFDTLPSIDISEERLAMEKLSVNDPSTIENNLDNNKQQQVSSNDSRILKNLQENVSLSTENEKLPLEDNKNGIKIKFSLNRKKINSTKKSIKSIKLKISSSKSEEKENKVDYMDIEKQNINIKENSNILDFTPISYRLRSRTNNSNLLNETLKEKSITSIKKVTTRKSVKSTKNNKLVAKNLSIKKTNNSTKKGTDNIRNILKVGKRNVTAISTIPKKNKATTKRNILDEKSVNSLHLGKKIKVK